MILDFQLKQAEKSIIRMENKENGPPRRIDCGAGLLSLHLRHVQICAVSYRLVASWLQILRLKPCEAAAAQWILLVLEWHESITFGLNYTADTCVVSGKGIK